MSDKDTTRLLDIQELIVKDRHVGLFLLRIAIRVVSEQENSVKRNSDYFLSLLLHIHP